MGIVMLGMFALPGMALAEAEIGLDANSAYVWRGLTYNKGLVLQPWMDVTTPFGLNFNVWANFDIDDYDDTLEENEFSEVDLTISYSRKVGPIELSVGAVKYVLTGDADSTGEIYVLASGEIVDGFSAKAGVYYDFDELEGFYGSLGLCYGRNVFESLLLEGSLTVGMADSDFSEGGNSGFHEICLAVLAEYTILEGLTLSGSLSLTDSLDEDVLPDQDVHVFGGVGVSYAF